MVINSFQIVALRLLFEFQDLGLFLDAAAEVHLSGDLGHHLGYQHLAGARRAGDEQAGGDITPLRNAVDNAADPNNLPEGEKVINLINGYYFQLYKGLDKFGGEC